MEITTGIHWLRGTTTDRSTDEVLTWLSGELGESVVVLEHGRYGYSRGFQVGAVRVYEHHERRDMGICVDVTGEACEELGLWRVASMPFGLGLKVTRLDLAFDHCPFTPADVRDAWRAGNVRTRCKVPKEAREDRQWRGSDWRSNARGDTFSMGSRESAQYGRCYDERGWTRFELELKGGAAQAAAVQLFAALGAGNTEGFRIAALAWVRRFVDFVDAESDTNASRRDLLPFWAEFVGAAEKARVEWGGAVVRTVEATRDWVRRQVAPALALVAEAFGMDEVRSLLAQGRQRWGPRHRAMRREWRTITVNPV